MNIYFDTEFTGLHAKTTLVSIGCISDNGDMFYGELDDFERSQVNDWMIENVFANNLRVDQNGNHSKDIPVESLFGVDPSKDPEHTYIFTAGSFAMVSNALLYWVEKVYTNNECKSFIQFVSDVCHYDMVLLVDLLTKGGTAFNCPQYMSASCHDINQDIARYYNISERDAFNRSREDIVKQLSTRQPIVTRKHNALYDAQIIRNIYEVLSH